MSSPATTSKKTIPINLRTPQRFEFQIIGQRRFGVCYPHRDGTWTATTDCGMASSFVGCPWEVLGKLIGDCDSFAWIDNDNGWIH